MQDAARALEISRCSSAGRTSSRAASASAWRSAARMVRQPAGLPDGRAALQPRRGAAHRHARARSRSCTRACSTTFVYVTHDQAEALTLADRIVVMREGVIQQIGTPQEIYERPRTCSSPPSSAIRRSTTWTESLSDDGARFVRGGLSLALATPLRGQAGRPVKLGIRAEDVDTRQVNAAILTGRVSSVLPVGSDTFLGVDVEGSTSSFVSGSELRTHRARTCTGGQHEQAQLFDRPPGRACSGSSETRAIPLQPSRLAQRGARRSSPGSSDAKVIAGGQSLAPMMNMRLVTPAELIDLGAIAGMDSISEAEGLRRDRRARPAHQLASSPSSGALPDARRPPPRSGTTPSVRAARSAARSRTPIPRRSCRSSPRRSMPRSRSPASRRAPHRGARVLRLAHEYRARAR